ncbi:hypothetical protein L2E82_28937 [Cichorium intybus]|uniref:Uncharacterized protein n=1 Tax=Cichorium intybus TaxID=13427 RepID=A0ACB9CWV0_CICIN|nr:hypothetical protein L2E82_28937 [Cichorium intybus]
MADRFPFNTSSDMYLELMTERYKVVLEHKFKDDAIRRVDPEKVTLNVDCGRCKTRIKVVFNLKEMKMIDGPESCCFQRVDISITKAQSNEESNEEAANVGILKVVGFFENLKKQIYDDNVDWLATFEDGRVQSFKTEHQAWKPCKKMKTVKKMTFLPMKSKEMKIKKMEKEMAPPGGWDEKKKAEMMKKLEGYKAEVEVEVEDRDYEGIITVVQPTWDAESAHLQFCKDFLVLMKNKASIVGSHDEGKAAILEFEVLSFEKEIGELLSRNKSTIYLRGAAGFSKSSQSYSLSKYPRDQTASKTPKTPPFRVHEEQTQPSQVMTWNKRFLNWLKLKKAVLHNRLLIFRIPINNTKEAITAFDPVTDAERTASSEVSRRVAEAVELLEKGREFQAQGDYVQALKYFTQVGEGDFNVGFTPMSLFKRETKGLREKDRVTEVTSVISPNVVSTVLTVGSLHQVDSTRLRGASSLSGPVLQQFRTRAEHGDPLVEIQN